MAFDKSTPEDGHSERSPGHRIHSLAMIVFVLNVLALLLLLIGLLTGWFRLSAGRGTEDGQFRFGLTINMSEVADDVETAVDEAQQTTEKVGAVADMETVTGVVQEYDQTAGVLTVKGKDKSITVEITEATEFEAGGAEAENWRVLTGNTVEVFYRVKNEQNFAVKVQKEADED